MSALPGLDLERLGDYLGWGPLQAEAVVGGRSNLTYLITRMSDGCKWILRRPPLGPIPPTAHDVAREYRVMTALGGTGVPVPRTELLCTDVTVLAAPFSIVEFVVGTPYRTAEELAVLGRVRTRAIAYAMVDALAGLHSVDPSAVGLADLGRSAGYLPRQLRRWSRQRESCDGDVPPGSDELLADLAAALPDAPSAAIVHGDYRLDNVLIHQDRVNAVLDFELSTLGDPLTDLGLLIAHAGRTDDAMPNVADAPGYPSSAEVIARYAESSGRDVSGIAWYVAFGYFKLSVIAQTVYHRSLRAGCDDDTFRVLAASAAKQGRAVLEES